MHVPCRRLDRFYSEPARAYHDDISRRNPAFLSDGIGYQNPAYAVDSDLDAHVGRNRNSRNLRDRPFPSEIPTDYLVNSRAGRQPPSYDNYQNPAYAVDSDLDVHVGKHRNSRNLRDHYLPHEAPVQYSVSRKARNQPPSYERSNCRNDDRSAENNLHHADEIRGHVNVVNVLEDENDESGKAVGQTPRQRISQSPASSDMMEMVSGI